MDRKIRKIVNLFPCIIKDVNFKPTSPATADYNCLAWANGWKNRWMWPNIDNHITEPDEFWPEGIPNDDRPETIVMAFQTLGIKICQNNSYEEGFTKIALYKSLDGTKATHAARLLPSGLWTSKLGHWEDIQHGSPESLEGDFYGKVFCYMKRKINCNN